MRRRLAAAEVVVAGVSSLAAIITIAWPEWIEQVFRVDPDHGRGLSELLIAGALIAVAVASILAVRAERRRAEALARFG